MSAVPHPGIYFGMPEDDYHAIPALSQSGIKDLLVDPFIYWANSYMNELRVERQSKALDMGTAIHKLMLEGPEAFARLFAVKPDPSRFPGALCGVEALRARCADLGVKKSGTLAEMAARIRVAGDVTTPLWPEIEAAFDAEAAGKVVLSGKDHADVRLALLALERMPSLREVFRSGRSEVSMVWTHPSGVPMKARADYLRLSDDGRQAIIADLKTYANQMGKQVDQAIWNEIARNRYYVQPAVYLDGLRAIQELYAEKGMEIVHGDVDEEWIERLMTAARRRFYFVFVQKGTPICAAREWARGEADDGSTDPHWDYGEKAYAKGVEMWRECSAFFKGEPWITDHGVRKLRDIDSPAWMFAEPMEPKGAPEPEREEELMELVP